MGRAADRDLPLECSDNQDVVALATSSVVEPIAKIRDATTPNRWCGSEAEASGDSEAVGAESRSTLPPTKRMRRVDAKHQGRLKT